MVTEQQIADFKQVFLEIQKDVTDYNNKQLREWDLKAATTAEIILRAINRFSNASLCSQPLDKATLTDLCRNVILDIMLLSERSGLYTADALANILPPTTKC
jgi:hypothetical protein